MHNSIATMFILSHAESYLHEVCSRYDINATDIALQTRIKTQYSGYFGQFPWLQLHNLIESDCYLC